MPLVEVTLPKEVDIEIDRLVDREAFVNREQALKGLLEKGLAVYDSAGEPPTGLDTEVFTRAQDDQRDPALDDDRP